MRPSFSALPLLAVICTSLWGCSSLAAPDEWSSAKEKKANALFKELCATRAKETVFQTVNGVKGYLWESLWPTVSDFKAPDATAQLRNPKLPAAADYCTTCLSRSLLIGPTHLHSYTEIKLPSGEFLRLDRAPNRVKGPFVSTITASHSRYVVSFKDEATPEMRDLWIGGSRLQIRDIETGALLAERTSFARGDPSLLHSPHPTGPWARTVRCPEDPRFSGSLILKVLNPHLSEPSK